MGIHEVMASRMPPPMSAVALMLNAADPTIALGSVETLPQLLPQLLSQPLNEVAN
jgi:hypothetical protein